jgi:hypothetical protein
VTTEAKDADDLVTEEIVDKAVAAFDDLMDYPNHGFTNMEGIGAALRAVAPMIAARVLAMARLDKCVCAFDKDGNLVGACMEHTVWRDEAIAAAIRARGTP